MVHVRGVSVPLQRAIGGDANAFREVQARVAELRAGLASLPAPAQKASASELQRMQDLTQVMVARSDAVSKFHQAGNRVREGSADLLRAVEAVEVDELTQRAPASRLAAVNQLTLLSQRIGRSAAEALTLSGFGEQTLYQLAKDTKSFTLLATALRDGSPELRIAAARGKPARDRLDRLIETFRQTADPVNEMLLGIRDMAAAVEAHRLLSAALAALDASMRPSCLQG
jgi:twitching motility protein PilJ